jgi:hypothetical protein
MTTFNKVVLFVLALACLSFGQTVATQTTLSTALTAAQSNNIVCLASATGVALPASAPTGLLIDREFMYVQAATPNALCFSVTRGYGGTATAPHLVSSVVWVGATGGQGGSPFTNTPPQGGVGSPCTPANETYNPRVVVGAVGYNLANGQIWSCSANNIPANTWEMVPGANASAASQDYNVLDTGANNALVITLPGLPQTAGIHVAIKLAHSLQIGANTIALNGGTPVAIQGAKTLANITAGYVSGGTINVLFDGTRYVDISQ